MNFSYVFTKPPDRQWGSNLGNNTWTGMVHMLQTQQIDIGKLKLVFKRPLQLNNNTVFAGLLL